MVVYSSTGNISYWDLESGKESDRFSAPEDMSSLVLFGNRRFFAGIDSKGLVVVEAVSGQELARDTSLVRGTLIPDESNDTGFLCFAGGNIHRFRLEANGRLERGLSLRIPGTAGDIRTVRTVGDLMALGSAEGTILLQEPYGALRSMKFKKQKQIIEAAIGSTRIAFLTADGRLGYIPLDFSRFTGNSSLSLESAEDYTRLASAPGDDGEERFILWKDSGARLSTASVLDGLLFRTPLRSVSALGKTGLFLDSVGNISVLSLDTGDPVFSFSSIGSMDAAFFDGQDIVIGRSALSGDSPFLMVDIVTGETLPLPYPATVGALVYRGASGTVYAAAVDEKEGGNRTSIIRLDTSDSPGSARLVEYQGEDTVFSIAEAGGTLASTLGGDEAASYTAKGLVPFERGPGFPRRLIGGGPCFIVLDSDGNISWHDPATGRILAIFRIGETEWFLHNPQSGLVSGNVVP
jgi:hypothetical protein